MKKLKSEIIELDDQINTIAAQNDIKDDKYQKDINLNYFYDDDFYS